MKEVWLRKTGAEELVLFFQRVGYGLCSGEGSFCPLR